MHLAYRPVTAFCDRAAYPGIIAYVKLHAALTARTLFDGFGIGKLHDRCFRIKYHPVCTRICLTLTCLMQKPDLPSSLRRGPIIRIKRELLFFHRCKPAEAFAVIDAYAVADGPVRALRHKRYRR